MAKVKIGYMCDTDFLHEIGEGNAAGGTSVYKSVKDLKECRDCVSDNLIGDDGLVHSCGIVKVEVTEVEVVEPGYFGEKRD